MNAAHLHLAINHIPVVGVGFVILIMIVGLLRGNEYLQRIGVVGLVLQAVLAVPAYLTGEPAEHLVENLAGVAKATVERHEEAAQIAFTVLVVAGVLSLAGLALFRRKTLPRWFATVVLVVSIATSALMAWTANLGGQIRHPEIVSSTTTQQQSGEDRHHE